ncbi:unnamed protein product [Linum tenue]|uniref:Uncharacterized protein n=1 Tax=Linum tenue TaxID=586396 RepID=A0AAV0PQG1_9ROSI|nr:unnamed protein product [Linum tenue]
MHGHDQQEQIRISPPGEREEVGLWLSSDDKGATTVWVACKREKQRFFAIELDNYQIERGCGSGRLVAGGGGGDSVKEEGSDLETAGEEEDLIRGEGSGVHNDL